MFIIIAKMNQPVLKYFIKKIINNKGKPFSKSTICKIGTSISKTQFYQLIVQFFSLLANLYLYEFCKIRSRFAKIINVGMIF